MNLPQAYYPVKSLEEVTVETIERRNAGTEETNKTMRVVLKSGNGPIIFPYEGPEYKVIKDLQLVRTQRSADRDNKYDVAYVAQNLNGLWCVSLGGTEYHKLSIDELVKAKGVSDDYKPPERKVVLSGPSTVPRRKTIRVKRPTAAYAQ